MIFRVLSVVFFVLSGLGLVLSIAILLRLLSDVRRVSILYEIPGKFLQFAILAAGAVGGLFASSIWTLFILSALAGISY